MKRILLVLCVALLVSSAAMAQVIADFEKDANGFADNGWGSGLSSVGRVADPTAISTGSLKVVFDGTKGGSGVIQVDNSDLKKGQVLTYWIYLPKGIPDTLAIVVWGQDSKNWNHTTVKYHAYDIPKEVWYPITFNLEQLRLDTVRYKFDAMNNKMGKMGIEFNMWDVQGPRTWTGSIYIDNMSLLGVQPSVLADFEKDANGFADNGWGSGLNSVAMATDPTGVSKGVLKVDYSGTKGGSGVIQVDGSDLKKGMMLAYWIYLPVGVPDTLVIQLWAQDAKNWNHTTKKFHAYDIPKAKWYPIYFNLDQFRIDTAHYKFDGLNNKMGKMGIEFNMWDIQGPRTWAGSIYIDNMSILNTQVGDKWVIADFNAAAADVQGFSVSSWAPSGVGLSRTTETGGNGVLKLDIEYPKGTGDNANKVAVQKGDIKLRQANDTTTAKEITIDVLLPANFPGTSLEIVYQSTIGWGWSNTTYTISDSTIPKGKWATLRWKASDFPSLADTNFKSSAYVYVQFAQYSGNWTGSVLFDNLTLVGVKPPAGKAVSPALTVKKDTVKTKSGSIVDFVQFDWVDNTLATESYNLYYSKTPITDVNAAGVHRFAPGIPHGQQRYAHRPWTTNGDSVTLYYAITIVDAGVEYPLEAGSAVGPIKVKSSKTMKVKYVKDFATKFQLDGADDEFAAYKDNQIVPETAGERDGANWTNTNTDCNFKTTMVIDDKFLYISADVADDDVNADSKWQSWQGDALEFYFGFYDRLMLKSEHAKNFSRTNGDWRIGFNSRGKTTLDGGNDATVPGVESAVLVKFTGDGYIAEAKICLDSVAAGSKFGAVYNGMTFPLKIDCNDLDPSKGDSARSLIVQAGGNPFGSKVDMEQEWLRPAAWGGLEVINGPANAVEENEIPMEYKLYANYPNPFNPSTKICYDLKQDVNVQICVFNLLGQKVATLVNERQTAGRHAVVFNAHKLASGMYIYQMTAGSFLETKKMLLTK